MLLLLFNRNVTDVYLVGDQSLYFKCFLSSVLSDSESSVGGEKSKMEKYIGWFSGVTHKHIDTHRNT